MQLEGNYTFAATVEAVWDALMDPTILAQALPGGEEMVKVGDNEYHAVMNVRVGPVQGRFEGRIELTDIDPLHAYRMKVSGQGAPGFVNGDGLLRLESNGEASTLLFYAGDVQVGGRIAGVSQRLVESTAKSLTRQGLQALDREVQYRVNPPPEGAPAGADAVAEAAEPDAGEPVEGAPTPVSQAREWKPVPTMQHRHVVQQPGAASVMATTMKDVARDLASDYIPPNQQERVLWALIGALGMLLFVVLVRLVQKD